MIIDKFRYKAEGEGGRRDKEAETNLGIEITRVALKEEAEREGQERKKRNGRDVKRMEGN